MSISSCESSNTEWRNRAPLTIKVGFRVSDKLFSIACPYCRNRAYGNPLHSAKERGHNVVGGTIDVKCRFCPSVHFHFEAIRELDQDEDVIIPLTPPLRHLTIAVALPLSMEVFKITCPRCDRTRKGNPFLLEEHGNDDDEEDGYDEEDDKEADCHCGTVTFIFKRMNE